MFTQIIFLLSLQFLRFFLLSSAPLDFPFKTGAIKFPNNMFSYTGKCLLKVHLYSCISRHSFLKVLLNVVFLFTFYKIQFSPLFTVLLNLIVYLA